MGLMCNDCEVLHERLTLQADDLYRLKKTVSNLKGELRYERQARAKLIKEIKAGKKQHYRNGQKRGRTRNG